MNDITLRLTPRQASAPEMIKEAIANELNITPQEISAYRVMSRSIDARQKKVMINLRVRIAFNDEGLPPIPQPPLSLNVNDASPLVIIVGAGPAGLFGALKALELGLKPIVIERGKDVDSRRIDIADISRSGKVNPESNFCFGEGGAGTFSDGKLYTRSKKRGPVDEILSLLVRHGADEGILVDAHPHIGTDRLSGVIRNIREHIISHGGEVRFNTRMDQLLIEKQEVKGVILSDGSEMRGPVVLATGHSARDVYATLHEQGVDLEPKGIAMGVRLEHPQELIDAIQYHNPKGRGPWLPPAEYSFVAQVDGRGVYSFCMCPGGVIVPAASAHGELVVNGMSASSRPGPKANSGMVVEIRPEDVSSSDFGDDALKMMRYQESLEKSFYTAAGNTLRAPAQRMTDFVKGKISPTLPSGTYPCGMLSCPVHFLLPEHISSRLRRGLEIFGSRAKGFMSKEATVVGLESRTSSPVRIPRDRETLSHRIPGLWPAGEGAGYAGGIVSAAIDGRRAVESIYQNIISAK